MLLTYLYTERFINHRKYIPVQGISALKPMDGEAGRPAANGVPGRYGRPGRKERSQNKNLIDQIGIKLYLKIYLEL